MKLNHHSPDKWALNQKYLSFILVFQDRNFRYTHLEIGVKSKNPDKTHTSKLKHKNVILFIR